MQRFLFTFLCLLCAVFLFSCENEDVPAKATILADKKIIKTGEEITFKTTGGDGIYHEWDFGNGQKAIGLEHKVKYEFAGHYQVKLTTTNHNKEIVETIDTIMVGTIIFNGVTIWNIDYLDPNGQPWDTDGTNPDLEVKIGGLPGGVYTYREPDMAPSRFPFGLNFTGMLYLLNINQITVDLNEFDNNAIIPSRLMKSWRIDPYNLVLHNPDVIGSPYYLPGNSPKVSLHMNLQ